LLIKPKRFIKIKACTGLVNLGGIKLTDQLLNRKYLLLCAGIPAQEGQKVDHGDGLKTGGVKAGNRFLQVGRIPAQRENREAKFLSISFTQFTLAVGFEDERQMRKGRHGVFPAKCPV